MSKGAQEERYHFDKVPETVQDLEKAARALVDNHTDLDPDILEGTLQKGSLTEKAYNSSSLEHENKTEYSLNEIGDLDEMPATLSFVSSNIQIVYDNLDTNTMYLRKFN